MTPYLCFSVEVQPDGQSEGLECAVMDLGIDLAVSPSHKSLLPLFLREVE